MRHRSGSFALNACALAIAAALSAGNTLPDAAPLHPVAAGVPVSIHVEGLRSRRGQVLACLTMQPTAFPDCRDDPSARKLVIPAAQAGELRFGAVPAGRYAISLLHDENGNGKADMMLLVPTEGFGFSRNAAVRFGPPPFDKAAFAVADAPIAETIRMRYIF